MFWLMNNFFLNVSLKVLSKENERINLINNKEPKVIIDHTRDFFNL
jgi:hypothetical protein